MLSIFNGLREINTATILFRMVLAMICGGLIGIERSMKNRPAGFRTHILIIIGAATASLTGHYIYLIMNLPTDMSRLGAQVITGLGFIGAGTIIVTGSKTVKGLTTAAGLWATGIVGLSIGAGFYEGALAGTIAILFCEIVMSRFRFRRYKTFHCVINYLHKDTLDHILRHCKDLHFAIKGLQIEGEADDSGEKVYSAFVALRPYKEIDYDAFIREVEGFDGVINAFVR
ncbi:MAG: MgtC/SapB family protein [Lachnospiraceae bacterium]|nr:MgtC/SapB family protein [Lachnospiraceae bacterium]